MKVGYIETFCFIISCLFSECLITVRRANIEWSRAWKKRRLLRFIVCECYSWEVEINFGFDVRSVTSKHWKALEEKVNIRKHIKMLRRHPIKSLLWYPILLFPSGQMLHFPLAVPLLSIHVSCLIYHTNKLHGLNPRTNYTDRATAACQRNDCQLVRLEGATWSTWRIPPSVFSRFSRQEPLLFYQVAPQLYSRGWVGPVPDPLLFFW
jgi:hypothetical protein